MKSTFLILLTLLETISFAQNLKCEDFRNGTFTIENTSPIKMNGKLIRNGSEQYEIYAELPAAYKGLGLENKPVYGKLEWIDDCSYQMTYDEVKNELMDSEKLINSLGGIRTELVKIEGNCFYYKSSVKFKESDMVFYGIICKQ